MLPYDYLIELIYIFQKQNIQIVKTSIEKESMDKTLEKHKNQNFNKDNHIFNIGKSDEVGALYIKDLVKEFTS